MLAVIQDSENKKIKQVAAEYRKRGYSVTVFRDELIVQPSCAKARLI
jgi:hypothetical protein